VVYLHCFDRMPLRLFICICSVSSGYDRVFIMAMALMNMAVPLFIALALYIIDRPVLPAVD